MKTAVELEDYKASEIMDILIDNIVMDYGCSRKQARKLILNALTYNVVANEIYLKVGDLVNGD